MIPSHKATSNEDEDEDELINPSIFALKSALIANKEEGTCAPVQDLQALETKQTDKQGTSRCSLLSAPEIASRRSGGGHLPAARAEAGAQRIERRMPLRHNAPC